MSEEWIFAGLFEYRGIKGTQHGYRGPDGEYELEYSDDLGRFVSRDFRATLDYFDAMADELAARAADRTGSPLVGAFVAEGATHVERVGTHVPLSAHPSMPRPAAQQPVQVDEQCDVCGYPGRWEGPRKTKYGEKMVLVCTNSGHMDTRNGRQYAYTIRWEK